MKKDTSGFNFVKNEHEVLKLWEARDVFGRMVAKNEGSKERFRFLDGPITANGSMCMHHVWGRTLKDSIIKYNTLAGRSCQYQNGFDAQGMWVEVEVEKLLGLNNKQAILKYGLDNFTEKCMERVAHFANIQTRQSKRIGQIMDWDNSYFTNSDENITSIWHFLQVCYKRGWLVKSYKSMPWCPRCGTSLSEHEMSGSYKERTHSAVFFKLRLKKPKKSIKLAEKDVAILVWTTTPWTLSSNVAVAVDAGANYLVARVKSCDDLIIVGEDAKSVLKDDIIEVLATVKGSELVGHSYEPPLLLKVQDFDHKIIDWNEVSATEGSGAVHIAPGCGAEDFELGKKLGLRNIVPIDDAGIFTSEFEYLAGLGTEEAEPIIFGKLKEHGTLYYSHKYTHNYPFCWRCKTNVVFKLVSGWDIRTDEIRPQLLKVCDDVKWEPAFLKKSMQNWLENMGDWNISRRRFYGLPLPIYECECGEITVVGSREELAKLSDAEMVAKLPHLHRPYIDTIKIKCPKCGREVSRISEVGDCWLDAGITAFSTKKYFTDRKYWEANFPSDLVLEMKEQVRLWFYSLLFMSVTLTGKAPFKTVAGHSTMLGEDGRKTSKTDPNKKTNFDDEIEEVGADVVRFVMAAANPASDMRFGPTMTDEARRKLIAIYNSFVFFDTYATVDRPNLVGYTPRNLTVTDLWLLERTNKLIVDCKASYESFKVHEVVSAIEKFAEELSNFYIRVNRRRFWKSENGENKLNAYFALYFALKSLVVIMTPITPFMCEHLYQKVVRKIEAVSPEMIMLASFPEPFKFGDEHDKKIIEKVEIVQSVIGLGQHLRAEKQIKVKQPLRKIFIKADKADYIAEFESIIREELNVKAVEIVRDENMFTVPYLVVNFKKAGAVLKGDAQKLKITLESASDADMALAVEGYEKGKVTIGAFEGLSADLFERKVKNKSEFVSVHDNDITVVLDTTMDITLINEGFLREIIRGIQVARQEANLDITARIELGLFTKDQMLTNLIAENYQNICDEVLATNISGDVKRGHRAKCEVANAEIVISFSV